jgi:HAD superfamily phosphoserine phosphatase-like hydrolase
MIDYFLFDLDGTITMEELLPRIATRLGVEEEIHDLTLKTISGSIPFEYSLRHRVEILNKGKVSDIKKIVSSVELNPDILEFIRKNKERCYIVTGNLDVWIESLVDYIGVRTLCSKAEIKNDKIISLTRVLDKKQATAAMFRGKTCAVGEGANDYGMFELANFSVAYGGVHEPARQLMEVATHLTYSSSTLCKMISQL